MITTSITTINPIAEKMNGKPVLYRDAKTVVSFNSPFREKNLCDGITLNPGDACGFSCAYCYVAPQVRKIVHKILDGRPHADVVIRRRNAKALLVRQLLNSKGKPKFKNEGNQSIVYTSTLVDIAANMELMRESVDLFKIILKLTHWQIRVLTKSNLMPKLVQAIPEKWHHRLILGVSTGTFCDQTAKAIEAGAAPVSKRLESLHWLQDNGLRTFGMICPSLPQEDYEKFAEQAATAIRVDRCEEVWAEVMNVRGPSFTNTYRALREAGKTKEAWMLAQVKGTDSSAAWEAYARKTFLAHTKHIPANKLRFLQYVDKATYGFWKQNEPNGAVLLGKHA